MEECSQSADVREEGPQVSSHIRSCALRPLTRSGTVILNLPLKLGITGHNEAHYTSIRARNSLLAQRGNGYATPQQDRQYHVTLLSRDRHVQHSYPMERRLLGRGCWLSDCTVKRRRTIRYSAYCLVRDSVAREKQTRRRRESCPNLRQCHFRTVSGSSTAMVRRLSAVPVGAPAWHIGVSEWWSV